MNMMFCPREANCLSCPLRKPSPRPTRSKREPTPHAIPNIVKKDRSLCAHKVDSDCRTMSRSMRMDFSRNSAPMPPGRSMGAPGNVQARGLNPAQPSDQRYAAGLNKVPYCMCVSLDLTWGERLARAKRRHPGVKIQEFLEGCRQ